MTTQTTICLKAKDGALIPHVYHYIIILICSCGEGNFKPNLCQALSLIGKYMRQSYNNFWHSLKTHGVRGRKYIDIIKTWA